MHFNNNILTSHCDYMRIDRLNKHEKILSKLKKAKRKSEFKSIEDRRRKFFDNGFLNFGIDLSKRKRSSKGDRSAYKGSSPQLSNVDRMEKFKTTGNLLFNCTFFINIF